MTAEHLKAIAEILSAIAWPIIILVIFIMFRDTLSRIVENTESFSFPGGFEAKFRKTLNEEVKSVIETTGNQSENVSDRQLEAAKIVGEVAGSKGAKLALEEMLAAAREYERLRASMSPGDTRTREMEKIVTMMRTLSFASSLSLSEFMNNSISPGIRLAAIAILQVQPNPDALDWLAERFRIEQPFISYHAGIALLAASKKLGPENMKALRESILKAKKYLGNVSEQSDRYRVLNDALRETESNT